MSRIGKKPILIPENVEVKMDGQKILIKGPKGELSFLARPEINIELKEGKIIFSPKAGRKLSARLLQKIRGYWGLTRTLVDNLIQGSVSGYEKKLEIEGVGYRAEVKDGDLVLYVGFSHLVKIKKEPDIEFSVLKNVIKVSGIEKGQVGQMAARIRKIKPPDAYKGKGIRYFGEVIKKKAGKKAAGAVTK